ncbi:MAG TPA: hypothetical protein DE042_04340 [Colwellia sp.]|nr:hypothetical protein [Colwellia sp.]
MILANNQTFLILRFLYIPKPPQDASFRMPERNIIKVHLFINGHSIKNRCNAEYYLFSHPRRACL